MVQRCSLPSPESVPAPPAPLAPSASAHAPHRAQPPTPRVAEPRPYDGLVPLRRHRSPYPTRPRLGIADAGAWATTRGAAVGRAAPAAEYRPDPASTPSDHLPVAAAHRGPVPAAPHHCARPRWATH